MQKTHMKLGMFIAMTCLFLAAGMFISGGPAHAQSIQVSKKFHHWFAQAPHISLRMLPNTAHHSSRAVIYGVGFDACNCAPVTSSYNSCDTSCNSTTNADTTCSATSCSSTSTTNTNTTTTTTTTITTSSSVPSPSTSCSNACSNTVPSTSTTCYSTCSNTVPSPSTSCSNTCSNTVPSPSTTCYSTCSNTVPSPSTSCPNDCSNTVPSTSTTCYSTCSNTVPSPSTSYNSCSCSNTANLQSSASISAPGVNLSQIPVNAFGEFQVTVNLQPTTRHYYTTQPTIWAVNSYNDQPSNYAPMCTCSW